MKIEPMAVDVIDVGVRLRPVNDAAVVVLAESMQRLGQLNPISVYRSAGKTYLVTGFHRLKAAKRLKWKKIETIIVTADKIERELQEIAENLHRAELTVLERDTQIARWIDLTEAKARQDDEPLPGGKQPKEKGQSKAARKLGISEPDARRAAKVGSISPEAKQAARDAGLMTAARHCSRWRRIYARRAGCKSRGDQCRKIGIEGGGATGVTFETENVVSFPKVDQAAQNNVNQQAIDRGGSEDDYSTSAKGDAESRAHAFRDALSTMDIVSVGPHDFWAIFGGALKAKSSNGLTPLGPD